MEVKLHDYCKKGNIRGIKTLLKKNHNKVPDDIESLATIGMSFINASRFGYLEILKLLITIFPISDYVKKEIFTNAAKNGYLEILEWSIEMFPNTNFDTIIDYCFIEAANNGHLRVLKWIFKLFPININAGGGLVIISAACNGHLEIIRWIKETFPYINIGIETAFKGAAYRNRLEVLKLLVELAVPNISIDIQCGDNYALNISACYGHLEIVKWLIENFPGINDDDDIETAFIYATNNNQVEVLKYLFSISGDKQELLELEESEGIQEDLMDNYVMSSKTSPRY